MQYTKRSLAASAVILSVIVTSVIAASNPNLWSGGQRGQLTIIRASSGEWLVDEWPIKIEIK